MVVNISSGLDSRAMKATGALQLCWQGRLFVATIGLGWDENAKRSQHISTDVEVASVFQAGTMQAWTKIMPMARLHSTMCSWIARTNGDSRMQQVSGSVCVSATCWHR